METKNWRRSLYLMVFVQFISATGFYIVVPFLPLYLDSLNTTSKLPLELQIAFIFSGPSAAMMITSPFWGALADRTGQRIMVLRALFGGAVIFFLMGFVRSAEQLILLRVFQGVLTGTMAATNALVASLAPRNRVGFSMGFMQFGLGAGLALGPLIGGVIADNAGYAFAFTITAGLMFSCGILVLAIIREGPNNYPQEATIPFRLVYQWRAVVTRSGIPAILLIRFLIQLAWAMIIPMLPIFIASLSNSGQGINAATGLVVGAGAASMITSSLATGPASDKLENRIIIQISAIGACLIYIPQAFATDVQQLILLQAISGIPLGVLLTATTALMANLSRTGQEGSIFGIDNSIGAGSRVIAPLIASGIVIILGIRELFLTAGGFYLVIALIVYMYRRTTISPNNNERPL